MSCFGRTTGGLLLLLCGYSIAAAGPTIAALADEVLRKPSPEVLEGEDARQYALLLCNGYIANREKFQRYVCRCRLYVSTDIPSVEVALRGNLPPATDAVCLLAPAERAEAISWIARLNDTFHYRLEVPERKSADQATDPRPQELKTSSTISCPYSGSCLWNRNYQIRTNPLFPAQFGDSQGPGGAHRADGPWLRGGQWSVDIDAVLSALEGQTRGADTIRSLKVHLHQPMFGRSTTLVELYGLSYPPALFQIWFDESRGYIPIRTHIIGIKNQESGNNSPRVVNYGGGFQACLDIRRVSNGWWPYHWVSGQVIVRGDVPVEKLCDASGDLISSICFWETKVEELELKKPPRHMLTVTLPAGLAYYITPEGLKPVRLREPMQITAEDIGRLIARAIGEAEPPPARRPVWRTAFTVALAVLLSTAVLAWVGYRWYRRRCG